MMRGHTRKIHSLSRMISEPQRTRGPKTPKEIRAAGVAAFRNHDRLQMLFEQWTQCKGQWKESEFMISLKQKRRNRAYGCRRWMTKNEIIQKFGDVEIAEQIIAAKMDDSVKGDQVRAHPDLHGKDTEDRAGFGGFCWG